MEEEGFFYGALAYLSTNGAVDTDACGRIMNVLTEAARAVAQEAGSSPYLVADDSGEEADMDLHAEAVLDHTRVLNVVNHILYNYEYQTMIDNHVQYLMGRNPAAVNLVTDDSEFTYSDAGLTGTRTNPLQAARLVFLLSSVDKGRI